MLEKDTLMAQLEQEHRDIRAEATALRLQIQQWEWELAAANPPFQQAKHLIMKFGGLLNFSLATRQNPQTILRYAAEEGLLPASVLMETVRTSRLFGLILSASDLYPDIAVSENGSTVSSDAEAWLEKINPMDDETKHWHDLLAFVMSSETP